MNNNAIDNVQDITFTGGGKGYEFKIKTPTDIQGMIELMNAFVDVFEIGFTLKEEKFKKFPKKFIIEESIKEVDNLF